MANLERKHLVDEVRVQAQELGLEINKGQSELALKAVEKAVLVALENGGSDSSYDAVRLAFGTLKVVDVPEKSGVSKLQGVEKAWTKPAHKTARFKASQATKDALSK